MRPEDSPEPIDPVVDDLGQTVSSGENTIPSWKDKLLGSGNKSDSSQVEEDFKLQDDDVLQGEIDGIPSITFSDRVHNFIDQRMSRTMVIWKTKQALQILDLENDYFSVRFQNEHGYIAAISEGLWIIFGHYLMVRLPGLPEGMYTKSLLKSIGGVIGSVAKIDQNTKNRSRGQFARLAVFVNLDQPLVSKIVIDGRIQQVPKIPEKTEEERFGPWMLVEQKKRRGSRPETVKLARESTAGESKGSRFDSLSGFLGDDQERISQEVMVEDAWPSSSLAKNSFDDGSKMKPIIIGRNMGSFNFQAAGPNLVGEKHLAVAFNSIGKKTMVDANSQKRESSNLVLSMGKNTGKRPNGKNLNIIGENSGQEPLILKANVETSIPVAEAVGEIIHGLHSLMGKSSKLKDDCVVGDVSDFIVLFEPRISGVKAGSVITKLGFDYSFRVEASGFSGGIWVLWKAVNSVEILQVHSQFIHIRIWDKRCCRPFLCTAIYASPQRGTRAQLWEYLDKIALGVNEPWLLSGDFNVIMNSDERQSGAFKNKSGCYQFRSFFFEHGFFDMGFQGLKFTWSKGTLLHRLDRSLCNKD
ncbi:hypothetical protein J1N35_025857 [Gossypium stocksii]|uniref:DUF4283 domain-containing protein n=1 Tax=Gossypium stocksii TaxID=47602 RepID=A0A9D3V718_9ROSI|nr:hypothetical protein J1N35_025857 [Gossypium stocksii]